jgi:di/tricarboxylate transporter
VSHLEIAAGTANPSPESSFMGFEAAAVLLLIALTLVVLAFTRIAADAVLASALLALLLIPIRGETGWSLGVLSLRDALAGFSNPGLITVGVLFIVVRGLQETGGVDYIAHRLLGRPASPRGAILRVAGPVAALSVFLNNTPVVAMLIPVVTDWARKLNLTPSRLMIPLSYSAILGGTCSLIGTSTNLVVAGLVVSQTDLAPLRMFDITWVGFPAAAVGVLFLVCLGPKLLPDRGSAGSILSDPREYMAEMTVPTGSPLVGRTIEEAGLRHLPGCYLVEVERGGQSLLAVGPEETLHAEDRLVFAGIVSSIRELQQLRGLVPATDQVFKLDSPRYRRRLFEAVVSDSSPVARKTIRESRFRTVYGAAVIAVARNGERLHSKIGDIVLHAGDTLLVESHPGFEAQMRDSRDFLLIRTLEHSTPRRHDRALIAVGILIAMVLAAAMGWLDMLVAAMIACGLMVATRCCTISEARASVDWSVLIVIGCALALGKALDASGAAQAIANQLIVLAGPHPWLLLLAVYATTSLFTEIITNNAAVALTFPIAHAAADKLDVNFFPFVIAIMMAGSASFATPLGYQTNMMVYGPGGYRFTDFLRMGVPMNLVMGATTVALTPFIWPF